MCVTGIVGCAGLVPTVEAIKAKKTIALANKETLISGGPAILPLLKEHGVNVIPADSEHSAIFQSLQVTKTPAHTYIPHTSRDMAHPPTLRTQSDSIPPSTLPIPPNTNNINNTNQGVPPGGLRKIILTASGGAFRDWPVEDLKKVTVADALKVSFSPPR